MLPDALAQWMDALPRQPGLEPAQLRALIQHLPDPQAAAQEMLRRGWITQDQFSCLFPGPQQQQQQAGRETLLLGSGGDDSPPDAAGEDWLLPLGDEDDKANVPPPVVWAQPDRTHEPMRPQPRTAQAVPALSGAASPPQIPWDSRVPSVAGGNEARRPEKGTDQPLRQWLVFVSKGMLMCTLFFGSVFAGVEFFGGNSAVPPVTPQVSREADAADPPSADDPMNDIAQNDTAQNAQPKEPVPAKVPITAKTPARESDAKPKPKSKASLYARVRQIVRENKTEETQRVGQGDIAYQNVADNGSIMVGMEVTYAPFLNHQIVRSVRPIYQGPDGKRYDGPVCGNPTAISERVVAKEGYAIGAAAISAALAIDGMQLTFMEIGADGLNPDKSYLSKWLGAYGGSSARTYVNDGRPIVGIAGMRSKDAKRPIFCFCLVTTKAGALADAEGHELIMGGQR